MVRMLPFSFKYKNTCDVTDFQHAWSSQSCWNRTDKFKKMGKCFRETSWCSSAICWFRFKREERSGMATILLEGLVREIQMLLLWKKVDFKSVNHHIRVGVRSGVNFINVLRAAFTCLDPKSTKNSDDLTVFLRFWNLRMQKLLVKSWWNWPQGQLK